MCVITNIQASKYLLTMNVNNALIGKCFNNIVFTDIYNKLQKPYKQDKTKMAKEKFKKKKK